MAMNKSASGIVNLIDDFLVRVRNEKTAADQGVSFMDSSEATPANQSKSESLSTSQTNLGVEQQAEANAGSVNIDDTSMTNTEADGVSPVDDQGPKTLTTDQPVQTDGDIGPVRKQEITQEQKMASDISDSIRLGNGILKLFGKEADMHGSKGYSDSDGGDGADYVPNDADDEYDDNYKGKMKKGSDKEAADVAVELYDKLAHEMASKEANEFYHSYRAGMDKRAKDEYEVSQISLDKWASMGISADMLTKVGGVPGLIQKMAMEDPGAVMPVEALPEAGMDGAGAEMPYPEGGEEMGLPVEGMPMEGAPPEAGMMAEELAGAGMEEGDLDEAFAAIQELEAAGMAPEEIVQAIQEVAAEETGMPVEEEKIASLGFDRVRLNIAKNFLKGGIK